LEIEIMKPRESAPTIPWPLVAFAALFAAYALVGFVLHWLLLGSEVNWTWVPSLIVILAWPVLIGLCCVLVAAIDQLLVRVFKRKSSS
jgi:polyferredoxin